MDAEKKKKLEEKGWLVGSAQDFLGLSKEEMELVELRIALGNLLKETRKKKGLSQEVFAKEIGTNQARVSRMETGDSSVSIDTLFLSLFHILPKHDVCQYMAKL